MDIGMKNQAVGLCCLWHKRRRHPFRTNAFFMAKYICIACLFIGLSSHSQPLRDINYEYLYNPDAAVSFRINPVRSEASYTILYTMQVADTAGLARNFEITWEGRDMLSDKEGTPLTLNNEVVTRVRGGLSGYGSVPVADAPRYVVARVVNTVMRRAWLFYTSLQPKFPVNNFLTHDGSVVTSSFVHTDDAVTFGMPAGEWIVSFYNDNFPAAAPVFSEAQARVSPVIRPDSVYRVQGDDVIRLPLKGLYLLQKDTASLEGFAVRAEEDYPQYTKLANLVGPLIYISTRREFDRLASFDGNKKAFDRVILGIATDTDRARILMRNYFRRVEQANRLFTSYKEGWKTDRGMVYIIFGKPDQVFRFNDREVWDYDNNQFKVRFTFVRSTSLFDPDNFVLIRDKKNESTWYEVVDLWRNARF